MRLGTVLLAFGVLGLGAAAPGCVPRSCLYTVCDGPYCRCSVAVCGEGATYDNRIRRCRCLPGRALIGGRCVSQSVANTYCGPGYVWTDRGCVPAACRPGDELDHATGLCIPHEQVNQVANNMGIRVGPGQKLGCPAGQKLVIDGQAAACVPLEQTCARDETWNGQTCIKLVNECPEGSAWDTAQGKCVELAPPSEGQPVDVAQWTFANYGPHGGMGAPAFCNAFAKKPWSFGVNAGSSAMVRVAVTIGFPEQQVARATHSSQASFAASGNAVPAKAAAEVDAAARSALAPLLAQGGKAATSTANTTVKCLVTNAATPQAVPATGGL